MKKNFLNRDFNPDDTHKSKTALRQCHTCLEKLILTWKNTILKFWNLEFLFWSLVTYFRAMKDILVNLSKIKRRLWFVNPGSWHLWTNNRPLGLTQPPTILISIPDSRKKRISNLQTGTFSLNRPQMTTFLPPSLSRPLEYTHQPTHTHPYTRAISIFSWLNYSRGFLAGDKTAAWLGSTFYRGSATSQKQQQLSVRS